MKERLNRLVTGIATMAADSFRNRGSRLSSPAAGGAELLAEVGVARRKAWPAVKKCLLKFSIIMDLSEVTVLPNLSAVGSWEEVLLFSMDLQCPRTMARTVQISKEKRQSITFRHEGQSIWNLYS